MTFSVWDLTNADITTALAAFPGTPDPGTDQIDEWINQFAGPINAVLDGHGFDPNTATSTTNVGLYYMFRGAVVARTIGEWFLGNQQDGTTYYEAQVLHYQGVVDWITGDTFKLFMAGQHATKPSNRDASKASDRNVPLWTTKESYGT